MRAKNRYFQLINPLQPPERDGEFGELAELVAEAATWLFYDPDLGASSDAKRLIEEPSFTTVNEAITAALKVLAEGRSGRRHVGSSAALMGLDDGVRLVNLFCDRFIEKKPAYQLKLSSGRTVGQRHVLCAFALLYAERAAQGLRDSQLTDVCNSMRNLLELICEIRRALDREAGSDVATRRALKRWEKRYRVRAKAIELYEARKWQSPHQARIPIYPKVLEFAESISFSLSEDRGEHTIYEWLLAHEKERSGRK